MQTKIFAAFLFFISSFISFAQKSEVFIKEDWNKALELAKISNKPIVVDFYTEWCGWCVEMDKKTFQDSMIENRLTNEFIAVKLDAERGIGREVAMKYRIHSFPTIGYFQSNGKLIKKIPGFKEPSNFNEDLDFIISYVNSEHSEPFPGISKNLNPGFPDMYSKSFGPNGKREFPTKEEAQNWFLSNQGIWESEVYFSMLYKFTSLCNDEVIQSFLNHKERYSYLYGNDDVLSIMDNIISSRFYKLIKDKNRAGLDSLILDLPKYLDDEKKVAESSNYLQLLFFSKTEDYRALVSLIEKNIESKKISNSSLNDYAWDIYQKSGDNFVLNKALKWMASVVQDDSNYMYLDTYASLAYKLKDYVLAKEFALKAIEVGSKFGDDISETEKLLQSINKGIK